MATTRDVIRMLDELRQLTVLAEGSPQSFKVRAYENAVGGIESAGKDVTSMSKAQLTGLKGVGGSTADKILEFVETGTVAKLEQLRAEYPPGIVELTRIPGLGPKTIKLIRAELGVENVEDLKVAITQQKLRSLPGLGATSEEKIAKAIDRLGLHGKERRTPISEARPVAVRLVEELRELDGVVDVTFCGSLRRHAETIGDIDITVAGTEPGPVMDHIAAHPDATEVIGHGDTKTSILLRSGLQVDVRVVAPEQFGAATLYFTGSKTHNIAMRQRAIDRGWLLNEYGLIDTETDEIVASATEEEIYHALDLSYIAPPLRENSGEIQAAAGGELPPVVEMSDIRGDLHYHTDRSGDGRSTVEEMVKAAVERGYEYIAITDHGEDLSINGSTIEEMQAHRRHVESVAADHDIAVLFGCELNIGAAGGLDYDQAFRSTLDWTVASIHSHFDLPAAEQTARLLAVIRDPTVSCIGHISGRYIGRRPGAEFDVDAVIAALVENGVALEVNGALERLDAESSVIRAAVEAGVRLAIDTDSHHVSELRRMEYGVLQAQRGWATAADVVNALPVDEFLRWVEGR